MTSLFYQQLTQAFSAAVSASQSEQLAMPRFVQHREQLIFLGRDNSGVSRAGFGPITFQGVL
jgi:hypothetical protein